MRYGTISHPKFRTLQRNLGLPQYSVVGLLESLWMLASQFTNDGDITRFSEQEISDYAGYDGDAESLINQMVASKWLDRIDGRLLIHDFLDHAPSFIYERNKKRNQRKAKQSGNCPPIVLESPGTPRDMIGTTVSVPGISAQSSVEESSEVKERPKPAIGQPKFSEQDSQTAHWIFSLIEKMNPGHTKPDFVKWANEIRLIRERDLRTDSEIRSLFQAANEDPFWRKKHSVSSHPTKSMGQACYCLWKAISMLSTVEFVETKVASTYGNHPSHSEKPRSKKGIRTMIDIGESRHTCEEAIISYALIAPDVFAECSSLVSPSDFIDTDLRKLFVLLCDLTDAVKASDINAVVLEINQRGLGNQSALGDPVAFLSSLVEKGYAPTNGRYYADQLRKIVRRDTVRSAAARLSDSLLDLSVDVNEAIARFELVTQLSSDTHTKAVSVQFAMRDALRRQREAKENGTALGMPTGFAELDHATGGFFKGQLVLLSARSYLGKTTLMLNLSMNFGKLGYKCSVHCLEMKSFELAERIIASIGGPELSQFTNGNMIDSDFDDAEKAIEHNGNVPVFLNDSTSETVSTLRGKAKYHRNKFGLDVLFVDHLQRLRKLDSRQETRHHLKDSVKALKDLAMELDICVVLLSQLRIEADDKEPDDTSYSESKQIYEEADLAMMLHRKKDEPSAKLILNKVRKAQATELMLNFDGPRQLFTDATLGAPWSGSETIGGYFSN